MKRARAIAGLSSFLVCGAALAQTAGTDNRDGRWVLYEEAPIHPMELSPDGSYLWVTNIADATVTVIKLSNGRINNEIGAALGPVTIRRRPDSNEMWVVCQSSGGILIFDATTHRLLDSISPASAVGGISFSGEPSGLVFDAEGDTAYVTLSVVDQVVEIDAATRSITGRFDFGSVMPTGNPQFSRAQEPRALTLVGDDLYVLSFESGNGTAPLPLITDVWADYVAGNILAPPPDRDIIHYTVGGTGTPSGSIAAWRMGTLDFDVKARPGESETTLYVSNMDMNNTLLGEHQFGVLGNPIADHRVTYAQPWVSSGSIPQTTGEIDLNVDKVSALANERFAVPNEMAFNAAGTRLYVACYESKTTAVIDATTDQVIASLKSSGAGPRGVLLNESAGKLYVYNRADQTVDEFSVPVSSGTIANPARTFNAGYDGTPAVIKAGRKRHIDASNSGNGLQSCDTCHVDGHLDRLAWDLGQFTGDLSASPPEPKDAKGQKVTMSLRGIEETAPFHWRGDREDLIDFNPAMHDLLGGEELDEEEFAEFERFIWALSYPPNPAQDPSRALTNPASGPNPTTGKSTFSNANALTVLANTIFPNPGTLTLRCIDCHTLDGFSATINQVINDQPVDPNFTILSDDGQQLRGLFDKASDKVTYASSDFAGPPYSGLPVLTMPASLFGFLNLGVFQSVHDFVAGFGLGATATDDISKFLDEFDTGAAPVIAWSFTLTQANSGSPSTSPVNTYLLPQQSAGNCDAVARGWTVSGSSTVALRMVYDPSQTKFVTDKTGYGPYTYANLDSLAAAGTGAFVFFGAPVGMGWRLGPDRDLDQKIDGGEAAFGASSSATDTDSDRYPDGYEIDQGTNPNNAASFPTNDTTPPTINPGSPVVWFNSNIAKLRWTTTEEATTKVTVVNSSGSVTINRTFEGSAFDREHVIRIRGMHPGQNYDLTIEATDPSGNTAQSTYTNAIAAQNHLFDSCHTTDVVITQGSATTGNPVPYSVEFTVVDEDLAPSVGTKIQYKVVEWLGTSQTVTGPTWTGTGTNSSGKLTLNLTSTMNKGSGAELEVIVMKMGSISSPGLMHFHSLEKTFSDKTTL